LERSLTVLLPVHNAQATLAMTVADMLELISEMSDRFELIIVDDGSDDATCEVADELAYRYPQIRAVRHGQPLGRDEAIRTGLRHGTGQWVVLGDELGELPGSGRPSRRGWRMLDRRIVENLHEHQPQRPNYLSRLRQFALGE